MNVLRTDSKASASRVKDYQPRVHLVLTRVTLLCTQEHEHIGADYLRLAFCKDLETLKEAGQRLQSLKPYLKSK